MFVTIRKMSDIEDTPGMTVVDVEKPVKQKKPRTEAQKRATAKALEALAEHRAKKYAAAVEEEIAKTPKGRTAPIPIATAPKPVVPSVQAPPNYSDDIKLLREELAALKKKKAKKPIKKVIYESESDDESEDEDEDEMEEVVVRGKKTHIPVRKGAGRKVRVPEQEPKPAYDNRREILESIFFRNQ